MTGKIERNTGDASRDLEHNETEILKCPDESTVAKDAKPKSAAEEDEDGKVYPPTKQVVVVMLALYLTTFLVSLVSPAAAPDALFGMLIILL